MGGEAESRMCIMSMGEEVHGMKIERLDMTNLREGVYCAQGSAFADEWYRQLAAWLDGGLLRGQIARNDQGETIGFVLYYPIENVPMEVGGDGLYMVQCLQIKPPNDRAKVARVLIDSAVADARSNGASGIVTEGLRDEDPEHGHVTGEFLENLGLRRGQSRGFSTLYYVVFKEQTEEPRYLPARFDPPAGESKLRIDIMDCGLCYVGIHNRETVRQVVERSESRPVDLVMHDQSTRQAVVEKGMSTGVFIDGKLTFFRGPVSEGEVMDAIDVADSARRRETDR